MKYGISIDLVFNDQNYSFIDSPLFDTMEQADKWYRDLNITNEYEQEYDIILVEYDENNEVNNSWVY